MADNPPPDKSSSLPPLPSSGRTGKLPSPITQLPKPKEKSGAGKIVVMLSSVAKPPPAITQALSPALPRPDAPPKVIPADSTQAPAAPLPPKQIAPAAPPSSPKITSTTFVKLPPKTTLPKLTSLTSRPLVPPTNVESAAKMIPPPLPPKTSEPVKKSGAQHIPPIKLNELSSTGDLPAESIFARDATPAPAPKPKPEGWKSLELGELLPPAGGLQSLEVFARSQRIEGKPAPQPEAQEKPSIAPPLLPPTGVEAPRFTAKASPMTTTPMPSPSAKTAEPPPIAATHVAPPMLARAPEPHAEKLPLPNLPPEVRKDEVQPDLPGVTKVPALGQPEAPASGQVPPPLPAKPLPSPTPSVAKVTGWMKKSALKKSTPLVLSSTAAKLEMPKIVEAKPALKPPVLPKRSLLTPRQEEVATPPPPVETPTPVIVPPLPEEKSKSEETPVAKEADKAPEIPATPPPPPLVSEPVEAMLPLLVPMAAAALAVPKEKPAMGALPPAPVPLAVPIPLSSKSPLPPTRTEKAKKRRLRGTIFFWGVLMPLTGVLVVWGSFRFGVETRVEGQAIPPPGMVLSDEVWIVTDFRELSSGIAEDLAAERTPLLQEIQERQDHVQRAQADVASREERIRLIQQDIQASKDEITSIVKQSRDDTQKIWDGEGAEIDQEYQAKFNDLQKSISDRAKSLKLNYQPDPGFPSPEVWANAYRLALYQVPAGVDSVKEHQWLGDQMKAWRDFVKTLDDRKEALREKAAQLKLEPAPKITDLNTKIDGLQQRADGTATEEVPLKAELQQAQADLAAAQASEAGLDDKYYKQLYALPSESVTKHIPLATNGRFSWVEDEAFAEGEKEHSYWIFARATRPDGRQYWALGHFSIEKNHKVCLLIEPDSFVSTKAILRPNLSPEEQAQ
jgi:hypothetical protein